MYLTIFLLQTKNTFLENKNYFTSLVDKLLPNDLHETEIGYFFGKHKTHTEESGARKKKRYLQTSTK